MPYVIILVTWGALITLSMVFGPEIPVAQCVDQVIGLTTCMLA